MSAELSLQGSMRFNKGGAQIEMSAPSAFFDVAGSTGIQNTQGIGTTDETLDLGDVTTIGFVFFRSLEPAGGNFVTIGPDGASYPIKLKAGEFAGPLRWNGAAIHAKANTAPVNIQYAVIPD